MRPRWGSWRHVHFVGIGGVGMCALAEVLQDDGLHVSGCDRSPSDRTRHLEARGITVDIGHDPAHLDGVDAVVVSAAVTSDHPELHSARDRGLPVIRRATLVDEVMRGLQSVAVAGTHGKTTTVALVAHLLETAGAAPTVAVGGWMRDPDGYGRRGEGSIGLCEADEFDRSFLELNPLITIVTNVEADHLDCYSDDAALGEAFAAFVARAPFHGSTLLCGDDPGALALATASRAPVTLYGLGAHHGLGAVGVDFDGLQTTFTAVRSGTTLGPVNLNMAGVHNVRNALAAIGIGLEFGLPFRELADACSTFRGVGRRFEVLGDQRGVTVVDDYAHHPTEIDAVLNAAARAYPGRRLVAVFQPHLFSRTRDFAAEFGRSLSAADRVVVLPVFPAREQPLEGVSHHLILQALEADGLGVDGLGFEAVSGILEDIVRSGDVLITLGAGDVDRVARAWMGGAS